MTEMKMTKEATSKPVKQRKSRKDDPPAGPFFLGYFAAWSAEGKRSGEFIHTPENVIKWMQEELHITTLQEIEIWGKESFSFQYSNDGESGVFFEAKDAEDFQGALEVLLEETKCRLDVILKPVFASDKNTSLFYGREF